MKSDKNNGTENEDIIIIAQYYTPAFFLEWELFHTNYLPT